MADRTEMLLKIEKKQEAEEILQLIEEMEPEERKEVLVFMLGARFAKGIERKRGEAV